MDRDDVNMAGGPAFPVSIPGCGDNGWQGMTLRDWFAGMVMANNFNMRRDAEAHAAIAKAAYEHADALLAARKKD